LKISIWTLLGADRFSPESRRKLKTVALFYFVQGSPPAILWEVLPVYFRLQGLSLRAIGGLRLLELPYSLKVFWSPLIQRYGDRRAWIGVCMVAIGVVVSLVPFVQIDHPGWLVLILLLLLTTLSATQDIAIDSYAVGLVDREEEGPANGVRASAYRVALVFVGGGMVFLAGIFQWTLLYLFAGLLLALLGLSVLLVPRLDLPVAARQQ